MFPALRAPGHRSGPSGRISGLSGAEIQCVRPFGP
jgi:hypothetical protein